MDLWTAQLRYPGPHKLDVTVKGKDHFGMNFAPSWDMVNGVKNGTMSEDDYISAYWNKLSSIQPEIWQALHNKDKVVLVCFCKAGAFCHRNLLTNWLIQTGASFHGEITDFSPWTETTKIDSFKGEYSWLSNFAPCEFVLDSIKFLSVEHYYQAMKFPANLHAEIGVCDKPKKYGRKAELPWNWDTIKVDLMRIGLQQKFKNPHYKNLLQNTGKLELIEGNYWHDNIWGNCTCFKCDHIQGQNILGKLLMEIREKL